MPAHRGHPGGCLVCGHVERTRIELLLAGGAGQKAVATKYGLSKDSVHRHWHSHVTEERRAALVLGPVQRQTLAAQVMEESSSVLDHYRAIRAGLYVHFNAALEAGDRNGGALVGGRLTEVNSAIARLTGELAQSPLVQNNSLTVVMDSPAVQRFLAEITTVLKPHPDALRALVGWLEAREAQTLEAVSSAPARPALEHNAQ